jgi:ribose transport system substrate-binding protein
LVTKDNVEQVLAAKPDPKDFTFEATKANYWAKSQGEMGPGLN